jgi:hypothetical protein
MNKQIAWQSDQRVFMVSGHAPTTLWIRALRSTDKKKKKTKGMGTEKDKGHTQMKMENSRTR